MKSQLWKTLSRFVEIKSPWLTLIGEKLQNNQDKILDYWLIEKADSVIVIPILNQRLLLPISTYRPGFQQITLDFPGGRLPLELSPSQGSVTILNKELAIQPGDIQELTLLIKRDGW